MVELGSSFGVVDRPLLQIKGNIMLGMTEVSSPATKYT